jgi:hypothetical protein
MKFGVVWRKLYDYVRYDRRDRVTVFSSRCLGPPATEGRHHKLIVKDWILYCRCFSFCFLEHLIYFSNYYMATIGADFLYKVHFEDMLFTLQVYVLLLLPTKHYLQFRLV